MHIGRFPLIAILSIFILAGFETRAEASPSFNRNYAKLSAEVAICNDGYLSDLDSQMASLYYSVRASVYGRLRRKLKRQQRRWLRKRNRCGYNRNCIERRYNQRINRLYIWQDRL